MGEEIGELGAVYLRRERLAGAEVQGQAFADRQFVAQRADDVPLGGIASLGQSVVEAVGEKRSTWRRWNLTAEAAQQTMGYMFATIEDRRAVVGLVVDAAGTASLRLTPTELASNWTQ